jgi:hypothetical protein
MCQGKTIIDPDYWKRILDTYGKAAMNRPKAIQTPLGKGSRKKGKHLAARGQSGNGF